MPTVATNRMKSRTWKARRRRAGIEYFLGYFATKEEAQEAERGFDSLWPKQTNKGMCRFVSANGHYYFE